MRRAEDCRSQRARRSRYLTGFTLIELLVAITILAVVAVLGWRGLDSIVRARVALTENLDLTRAMQLTFAQMQSDCSQAFSGVAVLQHPSVTVTQDRFILVRNVMTEDQPTRLQVVTYRLENGALSRQESAPTRDLVQLESAWQRASTAASTAVTPSANNPAALTLQSDVTAMTMRMWQPGASGTQGAWRLPVAEDLAPNAKSATGLEVSLQVQGRSTVMRKIFLLGAV